LDEVRLPDLETIRRFSIAVRQEHASLDEVLDALRTDLQRLESVLRGARPARATRTTSRSRSTTRRRSR